jgi:hypothetical protein
MAAGKAVSSPRSDSQFRGSANRKGEIGMKRITTFAFLIAVGFSASLHTSMAQSTGTAEDVLRQAASALAANDQPALNKLSIDQSEFKKYVWPALAVQMSGSNTSTDKYYPTYQKVSQVGITESNTALAGKKWEVVKVNLGPPQRKSKGFQLFGAPSVTLRDESGQEKTMRLAGGLLERDGAYRVTSYYVSPSQRASR